MQLSIDAAAGTGGSLGEEAPQLAQNSAQAAGVVVARSCEQKRLQGHDRSLEHFSRVGLFQRLEAIGNFVFPQAGAPAAFKRQLAIGRIVACRRRVFKNAFDHPATLGVVPVSERQQIAAGIAVEQILIHGFYDFVCRFRPDNIPGVISTTLTPCTGDDTRRQSSEYIPDLIYIVWEFKNRTVV